MVVLFCEVQEEAGNSGAVRDESTIEIGKAKEGLYILDFSGGWPSSNAVEFDRVHSKLTRFHDYSEVFDFRDIKLTLFEF